MERIQFEGKNAKEAESFVTTVNRIALNEEKHREPEWIAFFASSCFFGAALRWLADLDYETTNDWSLLRRAILQRWPTDDQPLINPVAPSAAAAPPLPFGHFIPERSQLPAFLRCTCCGGRRPATDQDFCTQWCKPEDPETASEVTTFDSHAQKNFSSWNTVTAQEEKEGKGASEETALAVKRKQRELERQKDLEAARRRQQEEETALAVKRKQRELERQKDLEIARRRQQVEEEEKETALAVKRKQRELERQKDLEAARCRQQVEEEAEVYRLQQQRPVAHGGKEKVWRSSRLQDSASATSSTMHTESSVSGLIPGASYVTPSARGGAEGAPAVRETLPSPGFTSTPTHRFIGSKIDAIPRARPGGWRDRMAAKEAGSATPGDGNESAPLSSKAPGDQGFHTTPGKQAWKPKFKREFQ